MLFARLKELRTPAQRVLIHPKAWTFGNEGSISRMLRKAEQEYGVKLEAVDTLRGPGQESTWMDSYTKLLVFNLTRYEKVLYLDNDGMVLKARRRLALRSMHLLTR